MKKIANGLLAACISLLACAPAHAYIVDTGEPDPITGIYIFNQSNYFAGRFSLSEPHRVTAVEAYLNNVGGPARDVMIGIYDDAGNLPGSVLFSSSFAFAAEAPTDWYGLAGLDWELDAGTYWAGFVPGAGPWGAFLVEAPGSMDAYAGGANGVWFEPGPPSPGSPALLPGVRIDGVSLPVPEPETYALVLAGLALLGFAARRTKMGTVPI